MVQLYDREVVREYFKTHHGLIFSTTEKVRSDRLHSELELHIDTPKVPDRIFLNGVEVEVSIIKGEVK